MLLDLYFMIIQYNIIFGVMKLKTIKQKQFSAALLLTLIFGAIISVSAQKSSWPKTIETEKGVITLYQPQPESLEGNTLQGRGAISVKPAKTKKPIFGAAWFKAELEVDRSSRIAVVKDITIPDIRFSDEVDGEANKLIAELIEKEVPKWKLELSVDDIVATLESTSYKSENKYKNDAPEIIISYKPATLVLIDGDPILKDLQGYDLQRIENSQYFIVFEPKTSDYYMYGDRVWFTAKSLSEKWNIVKNPSRTLKKLQDDIEKSNQQNGESPGKNEPVNTENIPDIILRTSPAELIVFEGEPAFNPIPETNLLYVTNSDANVFMDISSQKYFILISGRWYTAKDFKAQWQYIDADKLPAEFAKIPEGTEKDEVLASVAGTTAAREAVLDAQIPQTAEVNRKTTTVKVEYDGDPKFEAVDGTDLLYAVNSPQTVIKAGNTFYCVDNGIWFESPTAKGVWVVTDQRPAAVEKIEPSSPVYNIKYVYIYESTPEVVYVGYTPGYYGCYVYGPTIIYGTGYWYRPWYHSHYYPRPVTWGFSMHYSPWYGWGMSYGFAYGPVHFHYGGGYHGGYWGPPMYYPPSHYRPPYGGWYGHGNGSRPDYGQRPGNERPGNGRPDYNRPSTGDQRPGSGRPGTGSARPENRLPANRIDRAGNKSNLPVTRDNLYTNNRAGVRPTVSTRESSAANQRDKTRQPANNVYTDKNGNVYQQTKKGWETRENNSWKSAERPATNSRERENVNKKPTTGNSSVGTRPATQQQNNFNRNELDRSSQNRNRGATRTSNFNNYSNRSVSQPRNNAGTRSAAPGAGRRR